MDPRSNPFAPGAGTPPPELSGRNELLEKGAIALDRIRLRNPARSLILYGLRGVGKTVLLNRIRRDAEARDIVTVRLEAPGGRSLPALLAPNLRTMLLRVSRSEARKKSVQKAWRALRGFVGALRVSYQDIEVSLDLEGERGLADSGDLEVDLIDLMSSLGEAAADINTAVVIVFDELQYVPKDQLAILIRAMHTISQDNLPLTLLAAGLPQVMGHMGEAKSYAERMFEFVKIDRLDPEAARDALRIPIERRGAAITDQAIENIHQHTSGYPYFLQEWGKNCWDTATGGIITADDVASATEVAVAELDSSFFRVRYDRLTEKEKTYLRAMAELGEGPHRSGDIANVLKRKVTSVAKTRNDLIEKGMIYSPSHGETAFSVPLFDGFMKRTMSLD